MSATIKSTNSAAKDLGMSAAALTRLYREGIIDAEVHEGRLIRFDVEKVRKILAARAKKNRHEVSSPYQIGMVPTI